MSPSTERDTATRVQFEAEVYAIEGRTLLRLPEDASRQLPSRGQVAAVASMNEHEFATVLEPDGARGHWIGLEGGHLAATGLALGDVASVTLVVTKDWPEPSVPGDLRGALDEAPETIQAIWDDITPMARWEWVRWVNATRNPSTRQRRVEVSISKLSNGKRRPCCFDLASCTDPELSRSGKLIGLS